MSVTIDFNILCAARDKYLWTQEDLAAASGLSTRTIQRIESQGRCSIESLKALASALDVVAIDLIVVDETEDQPIKRSWIIGPILGCLGALIGCSMGVWGLVQNIHKTQADMSTALPALSFLALMTAFSIGFPAYMTYRYWNVSPDQYCATPKSWGFLKP